MLLLFTVTQPEELNELRKLLAPFDVDYQVLDMEFDQKSLIQARTRSTVINLDKVDYRSLRDIISDYLALQKRVKSSSQSTTTVRMETASEIPESITVPTPQPNNESIALPNNINDNEGSEDESPQSGMIKRSAPKRHSWEMLHREHKEVMGYNLTLLKYRAPLDPTLSVYQLCTIPSLASSNLFVDKASWNHIDQGLILILSQLLTALEEYEKAFGLKGFDGQSPSNPLADQRIPIFLSATQLVTSRLARSSGSVEDGLWALTLSETIHDLIRSIHQATALVLDGVLTFGDCTCALKESINLDCIQPDFSVKWEKIRFYSIPEDSSQLLFDNVVTNTLTPGECMTDMDDYFIRLPVDCCLALMSPETTSLSSCPSFSVTNVAGISTLQNHWLQLIMIADSVDNTGCIEDQLLTGDEVTTDCELELRNQETNLQTLVTNEGANSRVLKIVRGYSNLASDFLKPDSDLKKTWDTHALMIGMISLGVTLIFTLMVVMCRMLQQPASEPSGPDPAPPPSTRPNLRPNLPPSTESLSPETARPGAVPATRPQSPEPRPGSSQVEAFLPMPEPQSARESRLQTRMHVMRRQFWTHIWMNGSQSSNSNPPQINLGLAANDPSMVDPYYAEEQPFLANEFQRRSPFR